MAVEFDFSSDWLDRLPGQAAIMVFRIAQEALSNVVRHSGAHHVRIEAGEGDCGRHLRIADDGAGLPVGFSLEASDALGLRGMRERAEVAGGELVIRSGDASGAEVLFTMTGPESKASEGTVPRPAEGKPHRHSHETAQSGFPGGMGGDAW